MSSAQPSPVPLTVRSRSGSAPKAEASSSSSAAISTWRTSPPGPRPLRRRRHRLRPRRGGPLRGRLRRLQHRQRLPPGVRRDRAPAAVRRALPFVERLFGLIGLQSALPVHETVAEALAAPLPEGEEAR
ncbi:hypothetical protein ACFQVA_03020 [Actinomadura keratinilytica]